MKSTSQGDESQLYQGRKVVAATLLGNTIEYYEFFIYGLSASLVFNQLFFPTFDPLVGTLLSLSTFAIAFVARPVGGWIFGHFGDRLGRRPILMITLSGMGVATFAIGLLPTYDKIGIAAPICLVLLRLLQGLSLGGEASGGFIMTLEHAPRSHRTLFAGIVGSGNIWGLILGNGVFLAISQLPEDQLLSWGWRVPFLLSLALLDHRLLYSVQTRRESRIHCCEDCGGNNESALGRADPQARAHTHPDCAVDAARGNYVLRCNNILGCLRKNDCCQLYESIHHHDDRRGTAHGRHSVLRLAR